MALFYNGVNIPSSAHIYFNNRECQKVFHNGQLVWQRIPDYLFKDGNTYSEWTGGWVATPWYPTYGYASGRPTMDNRNNKTASVGQYLTVESTRTKYNGQGIRTADKIDFTNISNVEIQFSLEYGNIAYQWVNATIGAHEQFSRLTSNGVVSTAGVNCEGKNLNTRYTFSLDTRGITGSYELILSFSSGDVAAGKARFYYVKIA